MKSIFLLILLIVITVFSQGSREIDSLALVAIMEVNNSSDLNWNYTQPLESWEGVFLEGGRVDSLDLARKRISTIPVEFRNLIKLRALSLFKNSLKTFPVEVCSSSNLNKLELSMNEIAYLPPEIGQLENLTSLRLINNQLTNLPVELQHLKNLEILELGYNSLDSIPSFIGKLSSLKILNANTNQLKTIPHDIGDLLNLDQLVLNVNAIKNLPKEIGNLAELTWLSLNSNMLKELPPEIGNLNKLSFLEFRDNNLEALPPEIGKLTNLSQLFLTSNNLTSLPAEIYSLENLLLGEFSDNSLTTIPDGISELNKLAHLSLNYNSLKSLPSDIINLTNLSKLKLKGNTLPFSEIERCKINLTKLKSYESGVGDVPWNANEYSPQDTFPTFISTDSTFLFVNIGGSDNIYQWYENGIEINNANSDTLFITKSELKSNNYNCSIKSNQVTDLTLESSIFYSSFEDSTNANKLIVFHSHKKMSELLKYNLNKDKFTLSLLNRGDISISIFNLSGRILYKIKMQNVGPGIKIVNLPNKIGKGTFIINMDFGKGYSLNNKLVIR